MSTDDDLFPDDDDTPRNRAAKTATLHALLGNGPLMGIGYSNYHYPLYPLPSASGVYTPYTIPL